MNFFKSRKLLNLSTVATTTLATLGFIGTNPAAAVVFKLGFCGYFQDGSGQIDPSFVMIDTDKKTAADNFGLVDAKIQTTRNGVTVKYDISNFTASGQGQGINNGLVNYSFEDGESVFWSFVNGLNNFNVVTPIADFNEIVPGASLEFQVNDNSEIRENIGFTKDPDKIAVTAVPETSNPFIPLIALGLGGMLRKKYLTKLRVNKISA